MNKTMNITEQIRKRILEIQRKEFSEEIWDQARACLLDYIGVCTAGAKLLQAQNEEILSRNLDNCKKCTIIGTENKADPYTAILINGWNGHAMELDDGHRFGMIHLATVICPPLLALFENDMFSKKQLLRGIIAGYEVAVGLAIAMQPSHKQRGYHTTGTCGTIGAAAAIATAMDYQEKEIKTTLSAAATSAGGLLEIQEDGSDLKAFNAGQAALNGYIAGQLGKSGWKGPEDILGGPRGMLRVMSDWSSQNIDWSNHFYIETIYRKPYASCRHSHSAIEAAIFLKKTYKFFLKEIKSIEVQTYKAAIFGHNHKQICGVSSAKMSTPYSVAVALMFGKAGIAEFSNENIENSDLIKLMSLIEIVENEDLTKAAPKKRAAIVTVHLKNGKSYMKQVDFPKGEPENPMSKEELEIKFSELCSFAEINKNKVSNIKEQIWML